MSVGKLLIIVGLFLVISGIFSSVLEKFGLGRFPGNISFTKGNFTFHIPIVTSLVISIILSFVLNFFLKR